MRLILEEQQQNLQSFIINATYPSMNPDAGVKYQTVNLFNSDKYFTCFISDVQHSIRSNQHNTVYTVLVKVDVLDTCTTYMWSNVFAGVILCPFLFKSFFICGGYSISFKFCRVLAGFICFIF